MNNSALQDDKGYHINRNGKLTGYDGLGGDIAIPAGVLSIGKGAFKGNSTITSVSLPSSVTTIGEAAFCECENLISVTFSEGTTTIGTRAFRDCKKLKHVTFSDTVVGIDKSAFCGCESLESIVIPTGVQRLEYLVFANCKSLVNVTLPFGIDSIGDGAFQNCIKLNEIILPESVTEICDTAFWGCSGLKSIKLPNYLKAIGNKAFYECCNLTECDIPDGVSYVGDYVFYGCEKLSSTTKSSKGNGKSFFTIFAGKLTDYKGAEENVVVPDGVTTIGKSAFSHCESIKTVTLPKSVTVIQDYAFSYCSNLKVVKLPDMLTSIGANAFFRCNSLKEIEIPNSVTTIERNAFGGCISLEGISLSRNLVGISDALFDECRSLRTIDLPESVGSIGACAFRWCEKLESICLPEGISTISEQAFSGCRNLRDVAFPESLTSIGTQAFSCCALLRSVAFPKLMTSIGKCAFEYCDSLNRVEIAGSNVRIGANAFIKCANLSELEITGNITSIESEAFHGCQNLADSNGFVIVCGTLFDYIGTNNIIKVPDYASKISSGTFRGHSGLKSVSFPPCITDIEVGVFDDALYGKKTAYLPEELFAPQVSLSVLAKAELDSVAVETFIKNPTAYTDSAVLLEYSSYIAAHKKKLLPDILAADSVECLKLLANSKKQTKVEIAQDYAIASRQINAKKCVAYLKELADQYGVTCTSLQPVEGCELWNGKHFSLDGKTLIKYQDVGGKTEYSIPEGTKKIETLAFYGCKYIKKVSIPESVITIKEHAFSDSGIELVRLPLSLKRMSKYAFKSGSDYGTVYHEQPFVICYYPDFPSKLKNPIYIGNITDLPIKLRSKVIDGFLYAEEHNISDMQPYRRGYVEFIRNNSKTYVDKAQYNQTLLMLLIRESILPVNRVDDFMEKLPALDNAELIAALLEYKNRHRKGQMTDDLSFDETVAEKRIRKVQERHEQIQNQKGIAGLAFVASGDLEQFGEHNIYTGAVDRSKLKAFIEERGGFLRNSVSSKTDYLICNDPDSISTKCEKARELGIPVISEKQFLDMADS